ncbi:COR domain-containing protein [Chitinophaga sp. NPDC101104]|uniref:COR domain-containing protein n=1 Tax=Chitinophaga sp. NPDC101104 TaxID=3390561 RepID=UPI003D079ABD
MTKKPASILKLEKQLGLELTESTVEKSIQFIPDGIHVPCTYTLNPKSEVVHLTIDGQHINPSWVQHFVHLKSLTLRHCGLTDISFVSNFKNLFVLDLAYNNIYDISPLRYLDGLLHIDIAHNHVFDLSPLYNRLKSEGFVGIYAKGNPLVYPSAEVAAEGTEATAAWFDDILETARQVIAKNWLEQDPKLDLGFLGITDLSLLPGLFESTHLKELILSNKRDPNDDTRLPNNIFNIPPEMSQLVDLEILYASGDYLGEKEYRRRWRIRSFAPFQKLKNLTYLDIDNNLIKGNINLTSLRILRYLHAANNFITHVGSHYHLNHLEHINLSNNLLKNADFLKKMANASTIDLHSNQISSLYNVREIVLEKGIKDSKWLRDTINIADNPLDVPNMQVIAQGMDAVKRFFDQYEAERSVHISLYKNDDIKIIFAGNSNAGKSSLAERLIHDNWNDQLPTTHWMEIKRWQPVHKNRKYNIRVFDFGGQEYYHDTHYLFFSNNTAYVLLWDLFSNNYDECEIQQMQRNQSKTKVSIQGFPIPYWLESIAYHTQRKSPKDEGNQPDSPRYAGNEIRFIGTDKSGKIEYIITSNNVVVDAKHPPNILVAQNKVEQPYFTHFLDQAQLKSAYPAIFEFANISAKTGRGMEHFKDLLFEMIDNMPIAERECLGTWGAIKQEIENGVKDKDREMPLADFRKFCNHIISLMPEVKNAGLKSTDALWFSLADTQSYARYLNDIGLILYFPDNDYLKDKVFVQQDYVLKKIYNILEGLHGLNGKFDESHVIDALGKQQFDKECETIIELMKHFKIVFPHPSQPGTYIAPLYLPARPSKSISIFLDDGHRPSYRFLFQGFIHKHIILEFFHLYGQHALKDEHGQQYYYWKNGIVIRDEPSQGIVMVRFINATATSKAYIDVFSLSKSADKSFLKKITDELERLSADMNVKKAVTADGENFVPIDVLHAAETANQWVFQHNGIYFDLKLFRAHLKNELKMKKIFISYSKTDAHYLQQLENHLSALKRNGSISTWNCRQLVPGDKWDGKIKSELEEADIIIFLVSADFMATDYIWDIEIKRAIERENENPDVKVVPIIIRSCAWEDTPLSVYNTAPKKAMVLDLAKNIDEAFTDAVRDLKKIL